MSGNRNYRRGVRAEREWVRQKRKRGWAAARSAGSHGVYDAWAISPSFMTARFVQFKVRPPTIKEIAAGLGGSETAETTRGHIIREHITVFKRYRRPK